jgi:hypothetical protein
MRQIPVDTTQVKFIGTGKGVARAKYSDEDAQGNRKRIKDQFETDDQGRTIYVVDCLVQDDDAERAEIASVKVPGFSEPTCVRGRRRVRRTGRRALRAERPCADELPRERDRRSHERAQEGPGRLTD